MKNLTTTLSAIAILILIGLGCSQSDTKTADNSKANDTTTIGKSNENKNSNGNSNGGKTTANADSKTPISLPKTIDDGDIAGSYGVTGKNAGGQAYSGELNVKRQDAVYQFSWNTAGSSYDGVGVQGGNFVAAGFTTGADGKGCGAIVYKISDTGLEGNLASWGYNSTGTQKATLVSQTKTSSMFDLEGTDTDGTPYKGKLTIKQNGEVYQLTYKVGNLTFSGTGIRQGEYLAVGAGKPTCGYAVYEVEGSEMSGIWGGIGASKYGAEVATRK